EAHRDATTRRAGYLRDADLEPRAGIAEAVQVVHGTGRSRGRPGPRWPRVPAPPGASVVVAIDGDRWVFDVKQGARRAASRRACRRTSGSPGRCADSATSPAARFHGECGSVTSATTSSAGASFATIAIGS